MHFKFRLLVETGVRVHAWYITPKRMCLVSRDLFKFWEVSDYISETLQDRDIVAMED